MEYRLKKIIDRFLKNPNSMNAGCKKLADRWGVSKEDIFNAKRIAREQLSKGTVQPDPNYYRAQVFTHEKALGITESETDHQTGNKKFTVNSSCPLSPKEIEEMVGVDNISTFVDRSWLKSHRDNTWTYSVLTVCKIKDFYSYDELEQKLKEIFANETPFKLPYSKENEKSKKALFIYIADDHAGLVLKNSLYNREYSGDTYAGRLAKIVEEVKNINQNFSELYVIRLGDEMDGYNAKTTRYDHSLGSLSNKEQFDIYTTANKSFYDTLFQSGVANDYKIISLSNSNHTGLGFSHMANKALEFWLEAKYSSVKVSQQDKFIDIVKFGNHVIGLTHGKDEQYMKSPMPLNLDYKTDLWLMEYYKQHILNGSYVSTIKGDIHKYNLNMGKSGRYVNVASIATGSNWVEHNFGDSEAGALLEIYTADSKSVQAMPIWF
jgi:hypothetical protein